MIGKLKGIVDETGEDFLILDCNGVGYSVFVSPRTLGNAVTGAPLTLIIETHVREDHIHLYGFATNVERDWFRLLTSVQRVGSRMGLSILGALTPEQICNAILAKDTAAFTRISGLGPKLAERIVTELKDKAISTPVADVATFAAFSAPKSAPALSQPLQDVISALTHLGYTKSDAFTAAQAASSKTKEVSIDTLIRLSLKELAHA